MASGDCGVMGHVAFGAHHIVDGIVAGHNAVRELGRPRQVLSRHAINALELARLPDADSGRQHGHMRRLKPRYITSQELRQLLAPPTPFLGRGPHRSRIGAIHTAHVNRVAKHRPFVKPTHQVKLCQILMQTPLSDSLGSVALKIRVGVCKSARPIDPDHEKRNGHGHHVARCIAQGIRHTGFCGDVAIPRAVDDNLGLNPERPVSVAAVNRGDRITMHLRRKRDCAQPDPHAGFL